MPQRHRLQPVHVPVHDAECGGRDPHDVLGVAAATQVHDYAKAKGLDVTLRFVSAEETGAEHCQHDNPTIGQELLADWLADRFGIDQRKLLASR